MGHKRSRVLAAVLTSTVLAIDLSLFAGLRDGQGHLSELDLSTTDLEDLVLRRALHVISQGGLLSAAVASVTLVGLRMDNVRSLRFFCFYSLVQCLFVSILVGIASVFAVSPSLAQSTGEFICQQVSASDLLQGVTSALRESDAKAAEWGWKRVEVMQVGMESCEENWRVAVFAALAMCVAYIVLVSFSMKAVWECAHSLSRESVGWVLSPPTRKPSERRTRSRRDSKPHARSPRANSLPPTSSRKAAAHYRPKSNSVSIKSLDDSLDIIPLLPRGLKVDTNVAPLAAAGKEAPSPRSQGRSRRRASSYYSEGLSTPTTRSARSSPILPTSWQDTPSVFFVQSPAEADEEDMNEEDERDPDGKRLRPLDTANLILTHHDLSPV